MDTRTFQTKDGPEADRRPLWVLHTTLGTLVIARQSLDNGLFLGAHLTHGELLVCCSPVMTGNGEGTGEQTTTREPASSAEGGVS
jgi:hypothetical protein